MSGANCITCVGEYGIFQLVDPLDRTPHGYVEHVLTQSEISGSTMTLHFHFIFLTVTSLNTHREAFENDLKELIQRQHPHLVPKFTSGPPKIVYIHPSLEAR